METFTIGLGNRWWIRALGHNPLVRRSDRIEAIVLVFAVVLAIVAVPIAGAVGTAMHDQRIRLYAHKEKARHQVIATATAVGTVVLQPRDFAVRAEATWSDGGIEHTGALMWPHPVKIGDRQSIWVDGTGDRVGQPSSSSRADGEALGVAIAVWLGVVGACAAVAYLIRCWLDRRRYAAWDHEITASRESGRKDHRS